MGGSGRSMTETGRGPEHGAGALFRARPAIHGPRIVCMQFAGVTPAVEPRSWETHMRTLDLDEEPHAQLRALYQSLLGHEDRFEQFKELLAMYPRDPTLPAEQEGAAMVREQLNARLREWIGEHFQGLSATQVLLWRSIVVEECFNARTSIWFDPN
jgi:hypothetical protein